MLLSPSHAVIGVGAGGALAGQFERFGFESAGSAELDAEAAAALYGLGGRTRETVLRVPGAAAGWVRLVETPHPATAGGAFDHRPVALDLYTRDIERSMEMAAAAGARCLELVEYAVGPIEVREVETIWADHLVVVFLQVSPGRPSVLDSDSERLHSEVHSLVWTVPSADQALVTWRDEAGYQVLMDTEIRGPVISKLMNLPRPEVPVRFALLCDDQQRPIRVELLEFFEDPGEARPVWPLTAGLFALGLEAPDLEAAMKRLASCEFAVPVAVDSPLHPQSRAVTGVAPGGVRCELWQG